MNETFSDSEPEANVIRRELRLPHPRETVWRALADRDALAEWLYPNDFEATPGHRFTFRVPAKPEVGFDGLTVRSEVLELDAPRRLVLAWNAEPPVSDTRVSFTLESVDGGTLLRFEHGGFDLDHPHGKAAFHGAGYGWGTMFQNLETLLREGANGSPESSSRQRDT